MGTLGMLKDSEAVQKFLREHPEARVKRLAKPITPPDEMEVVQDSDSEDEV